MKLLEVDIAVDEYIHTKLTNFVAKVDRIRMNYLHC